MTEEINFNHRICLYKINQLIGEFGEISTDFEKISSVWGKIVPLQSNQTFNAMKQNIEITHSIYIRYLESAKECKKISFKNRNFEVISVICPNEDYSLLMFKVKEIL